VESYFVGSFFYTNFVLGKMIDLFKSGNMIWTLTGEVPPEISLNEDHFLAILLKFKYLIIPVDEIVFSV